MSWLAWRQLRLPLGVVAVAFGAIVVALLAIHPSIGPNTPNALDLLTRADRNLYQVTVFGSALVPALLGAFLGAPLVAREVEAGTHRLLWAQSVSRTRWYVTRLGWTLAGTLVLVGALSAVVTWWTANLDGATGSTRGALPPRLTPVAFAMRGFAPVGYALFAVAIGAAIGAVVGRTQLAMLLTLVVVAVAQLVSPTQIRPHLLSSRAAIVALDRQSLDGISIGRGGQTITVHTSSRDDWVLVNRTVDREGRPSALPASFAACMAAADRPVPQPAGATGSGRDARVRTEADPDRCLADLRAAGYRQEVRFIPASRFWTLQWLELAIFTGLTLVAGALGVVAVRRR